MAIVAFCRYDRYREGRDSYYVAKRNMPLLRFGDPASPEISEEFVDAAARFISSVVEVVCDQETGMITGTRHMNFQESPEMHPAITRKDTPTRRKIDRHVRAPGI